MVGQQNADIADTTQPRDVAMATIFVFLYMGHTLVPPGEYDWTVRVRRRCGLMSNYFDHLLLFGPIASNCAIIVWTLNMDMWELRVSVPHGCIALWVILYSSRTHVFFSANFRILYSHLCYIAYYNEYNKFVHWYHFIISERELTFTFAICYRPSVCRLSVCRLSVCRLSVCNVRAPYSGGSHFRQYFYGIRYLGHPWTSTENFTEIVPGEPLRRGSWTRGVVKYSDFGPIDGYISETVQDRM